MTSGLRTRRALLAAALSAAACTPAPHAASGDSPGDSDDSGAPEFSTFAGIESVSWDGSDGFSVACEGALTAGTLEAANPAGELIQSTAFSGTTGSLGGLPDGEYVLRILDAEGNDHGRTLRQWIGSNRLVYRTESAIEGGSQTVAGEGNLVALGSGGAEDGGAVLFDLSDLGDLASPPPPAPLASIPDLGFMDDVAIQGDLLAVATDPFRSPEATTGVRFYDISDPTAPTLAGSIPAQDDNAHTLTFGEPGILYLASTFNGWEAVYDVSDPAQPTRLGTFTPPQPAVPHDQVWVEGTLWMAYTYGLAAADTTDPAHLTLLGVLPATWSDPFVHDLWPTGDGATLAFSDESIGGKLRTADITDPAAMGVEASWQLDATHSIHNVVVRDHYAFTTWYTGGILVFDLDDPTRPTQVGAYDTWSGDEEPQTSGDGKEFPNVNGANYVWPLGRHIALSDSDRGLLVFDFFPTTIQWGDTWGGNSP